MASRHKTRFPVEGPEFEALSKEYRDAVSEADRGEARPERLDAARGAMVEYSTRWMAKGLKFGRATA